MEIETLKTSLIAEARRDSSKLIEKAKAEGEKEVQQAEKEVKELIEKCKEEARKEALEMEKEEMARAAVEKKNRIAEEKARVVDRELAKIYEMVEKRIEEEEEYLDFLENRIEKARKEYGDITVTAGKGLKGKIKADKWSDEQGVIVHARKGSIVLDYRVKSIFEQLKPRLKGIIYSELFKQ
ncbi:MAG: hypothetical protein QW035_00845 [Candidatus Anstonellales archaeon]